MASTGATHVEVLTDGPMNVVVFDWKSDDTNGNVDETFDISVSGYALMFATLPSPDHPPTDNYDIEIEDEWGFDVLDGFGTDRDTANQERVGLDIEFANRRPIATRTLTLKITNAGNGKSGKVELFGIGTWRDLRLLPT